MKAGNRESSLVSHLTAPFVRHDGAGVGLPKVAFIGTGGTIASVGKTPLDLQDYGANGVMMHADEIERIFLTY
jgi:L-asparaginase/Glu-tRNA(Gln) amidotransferase subunit D